MSDMKLNYQVVTKPAQVKVGEPATLMVFISNLSDYPVTVASLVINVPFGTQNFELAKSLDGKPGLPIKGFKEIKPLGDSYAIVPDSGTAVMKLNDEIQLIVKDLEINDRPGTVQLTIYEATETDGKQSTASLQKEIVKVVPDVKIDSFTVTPTSFHPGEDVSLDWRGTKGATYEISYPPNNVIRTIKGQTTPLKEKGPYTISNLAQSTTFTLTATGGPNPKFRQTIASIERARIETFIANERDPFFGEEVTLEWVVQAEHYEIEHNHKVLKKGDGPGGKLSGSLVVTPDAPATAYTLTVTSGKGAGATTDQRTLPLNVPKPEVSIDVAHASFKFNEKPHITWGLKNRWKQGVNIQVVGAHSKHVYLKKTLTADDGKDVKVVTDDFAPFDELEGRSLKYKLGVGENLILSAQTDWFATEKPVHIEKIITFDGIQGLKWNPNSVTRASMGGDIAQDYYDQITNGYFPNPAMRQIQINALALQYGIDASRLVDPVRWSLYVNIKAENANSIMVRVNRYGTDDWKKLWGIGSSVKTMGGKNWYLATQDKPGSISCDEFLYLFAPKSMVADALMGLKFIVGGKSMHVSWHSTGKKIELVLS